MRVLVVSPPQKAHLYIHAPLAWALRSAGHEVLVASQYGLAGPLAATGLQGVALGAPPMAAQSEEMDAHEPEAPVGEPRDRNPVQEDHGGDDPAAEWRSTVSGLLPTMSPDGFIDDLVAFARSWRPDLVLWDMLTLAGAVAARACGAAHARLLLGTDGHAQLRDAFLTRGPAGVSDPIEGWLGPVLERHGQTYADDVVLGQWTIDPMPAWTWHPDGDVFYVPTRQIPFSGSGVTPPWVFDTPRRPRVAISLGMSHRDTGRVEAPAAVLLDAVADLDVEVVATFDERQWPRARALPVNVRIEDFIPLGNLLPTCSALVHHGGGGSFAAAVEHGVPQLFVPSAWWTEKYFAPVSMANGVQDEGAGIYVADSDRVRPEALREAVGRVLEDPRFAANATRLRDVVAQVPSPRDRVATLESLTALLRGRPERLRAADGPALTDIAA